MNIDEAVEFIYKTYNNNDFKTLKKAKTEIDIEGYLYCFDALSLGEYYSKLPDGLYFKFKDTLKEKLILTEKDEKLRQEKLTLMKYSVYNAKILDYEISKETQPDFILCNKDKKIGVEVTELCIPDIKVLHKISSLDKDRKYSINKLREVAINKHSDKAKKYDYDNYFGYNWVSLKLNSVNENKKHYASKISKKLEKYDKFAKEYDEMLILCIHYISEILCKEDIEDIILNINYKPKNKIKIIFLYDYNQVDNSLSYFEYLTK